MQDANNQSEEHIQVDIEMPPILEIPLELQEHIRS